ncbi:winged helix-turn-helix transcriptional regulator [Gymnodinialimonas ceratoperidinii]|uniref:Helix-turn-helix transcriptional regulator n=1 Tax=Gymnodinialimonas ceratoperidinii TaxID=2856823 RepID=A0A8F6TUW1_9RHOB|nr:helix-turn-helix domain-containing protein [Gymnodinialimonas ceratoperidinii]QXT38146.1 helix-turn-helix transcriptional regulator [Gymnodinialimonas ceratoperidinii]
METTLKSAQAIENAMSCPSDALLRKLWGQWKTHVIYVLGTQQSCRFGVLKRTIAGISPKVLTQRLRELEADGLVWREQENTIPPKVTYGLTEAGHAIHEVLKQFDPIAEAMQSE